MPRGVKKVQSTETASVALPPVTDMDRQIAANTIYHTTGRFMCGDVTLTITLDGTLDEIQNQVAYLETKGWRCTLAPDAEARERKDTNRDTFEQEEQGNYKGASLAQQAENLRRAGQRDYQPKDQRLVMPFGKYKGTALSVVEMRDPDYVDWLAENAQFADVKKAAQKLVNTRSEDLPF